MISGIDFVIFWVDGEDPLHKNKRRAYERGFKLEDISNNEQSIDDRRFCQHDELKYCLRSIKTHASWYRNIYIITDNQFPSFLSLDSIQLDRIKIIDHKELFADCPQYLPTFNSRALAAQVHKLADLSDYFILGNDDLMLGADVSPQYFFQEGKPNLFVDEFSCNDQDKLTLHHIGILNAAKMLGFGKDKFYIPSHGFIPLVKSTLNKLDSLFFREFSNNRLYKFRHESQFLVESLFHHYCLKFNLGHEKSTQSMVHFSFQLCREGLPQKILFLFDLIEKGDRKQFCLNEIQSLIPRVPEVNNYLSRICGPPLKSEF